MRGEPKAELNRLIWPEPDRRTLYRAAQAMSASRITHARLGVCLDALLNDLELYDDPRQGLGRWLLPDECLLASDLAERLHNMVGPTQPREAGKVVLEHSDWIAARDCARRLLDAMDVNGPSGPLFR